MSTYPYGHIKAQVQTHQHIITGTVISTIDGNALEGATIRLKQWGRGVLTNKDGKFSLATPIIKGTLVVTFVGCQTQDVEFGPDTKMPIIIKLAGTGNELDEVEVFTGYQTIPKERATGSFSFVDSAMFNRRISTNVLDHIENMTTGVLFDHTQNAPDALLIRGRSTIYADASPLIVVDNFSFDGDLSSINPNDVSSVTILKDAAAASIWGARAGNGVIVITTKKGKTSTPMFSFSSNFSFTGKPDIKGLSHISSADYVAFERKMYDLHYYDGMISNTYSYPGLTPLVELLAAQQSTGISTSTVEAIIDGYKSTNVFDDIQRYFYQQQVSQQYALNVSGSNVWHQYYLSVGADQQTSSLVGSQHGRLSLLSRNTFTVNPKLKILAGLHYNRNDDRNGYNNGYLTDAGWGKSLYPYADLVDVNGQALAVVNQLRTGYTDTAGHGQLKDWSYKPYEEIKNSDYRTLANLLTLNAEANYQITIWLAANTLYQYQQSWQLQRQLNKKESFTVRDMVNRFYQPGAANPFPVPYGGILRTANDDMTGHQGRFQLVFSPRIGNHMLDAVAGAEIRELKSTGGASLQYGYEREGSIVNSNMDFNSLFRQYIPSYSSLSISNSSSVYEKEDRFLSFYANATYTYNTRYSLSASVRKDEANLFGVKENQRGVPLWSVGGAWVLSKESFFENSFIPYLKIRTTFGHNGNISRRVSALTTASYTEAYSTPLSAGTIVNPPNEHLRWEKVKLWNLAADFATSSKRLSGSIEFYLKQAVDLLGQAPADPTFGISSPAYSASFYGNVAAMKGQGWEINLTSRNIEGQFSWQTTVLFSYSKTSVSNYLMPVSSTGNTYLNSIYVNPVKGKPLFSLYSFAWSGLDGNTGDPVGYLNGERSTDWGAIYSTTGLDDMVYHGSVQPYYYGALRNDLNYREWSLSLGLSFKAGYYFRAKSINYGTLLNTWSGHSDYSKRWQQPKDEKNTHVPSFVYPIPSQRDDFYSNSSVLVEKGDHIRLQDVRIAYQWSKKQLSVLPIHSLQLYAYAENLGLLAASNDEGLDPNYQNSPVQAPTYSLGLTINF